MNTLVQQRVTMEKWKIWICADTHWVKCERQPVRFCCKYEWACRRWPFDDDGWCAQVWDSFVFISEKIGKFCQIMIYCRPSSVCVTYELRHIYCRWDCTILLLALQISIAFFLIVLFLFDFYCYSFVSRKMNMDADSAWPTAPTAHFLMKWWLPFDSSGDNGPLADEWNCSLHQPNQKSPSSVRHDALNEHQEKTVMHSITLRSLISS